MVRLPGPHERTSSVGPSILATRPRSLRRSFAFYVRSLLHNTDSKSISKYQHIGGEWTVHTRDNTKSLSLTRVGSESTFRQEPRGARPSPTPREGTSRNARTTSYNRTTDHTHTRHTVDTRPDRDGARPRDPRERGRGVDRAPALYKWRSPVLPSGHAGPQSPERNHSALRTPRPPPGASRPRRAAGIV